MDDFAFYFSGAFAPSPFQRSLPSLPSLTSASLPLLPFVPPLFAEMPGLVISALRVDVTFGLVDISSDGAGLG